MKKYIVFLLLTSIPLIGFKQVSMHVGSQLLYTRIFQECLNTQKGFLAGPNFDFQWTRPWWIYTGLFFDGLWQVGHICTCDGTIADNNQYDTKLKIGYPFLFESKNFMFTPHLGVGFLHFSHQIEPCVIRYKYNHIYVPIGFSTNHNFSDHFSWQLHAYYRLDAWTRLKVSTPDLCDTKDCNIKLQRSHGFHIELPLCGNYRTGKPVTIQLVCCPTFDWQKFPCVDPCDCNASVPIAQLKTWKFGTKALFGIRF